MSIFEAAYNSPSLEIQATLQLSPYGGSLSQVPVWIFGYTDAETVALFPDPVDRTLVFSTRFLYIVMRDKQDKMLIAAGVDPDLVYSGASYGATYVDPVTGIEDTPLDALEGTPMAAGRPDPNDMRGVIEEYAANPDLLHAVNNTPVESVTPPPPKPVHGLSEQIERKMVRWSAAHAFGEEMGDELRNEPDDALTDTFAVNANYSPLMVGGGLLAAAATLSFLTR